MTDKFPDVIYLHDPQNKFLAVIWIQRSIDDTDVKYIRADTVKLMEKHTEESIAENNYYKGKKEMKAEVVKGLQERFKSAKYPVSVPFEVIINYINKEF